MKKFLVVIAAIFPLSILNYTQAQIRKVPAEVTEAFKAKYTDTKNVEWKDRITFFQVDYDMNGSRYESKFSNKGEWLQTEKEVTRDALPAEVKDGYSKSKFTDWELKSVSWVESRDHGIQYRLFVRKSGIEKKYLYFDKNGKLVKDAITI